MVPRPPYARVLTRQAATRRLALLVSGIAGVQFALTGATILLESAMMGYAWVVAAVCVASGTFIFEMYKWQRGRGFD